jgi:uncharacterized damage-inducible protein DinB
MTHGLHDLSRHNAWATKTLIEFCGTLAPESLNATVPGTFGTVIDTLRHLIDAEMSYTFRVAGAWSERPWAYDEPVGLDVLAQRAAIIETAWEAFLENDFDPEKLGEAKGDDGVVFAVPAGIFVTQAFHHGNEHRAHICTILGAHGIEPPELSGWEYSIKSGRSWAKNDEQNK